MGQVAPTAGTLRLVLRYVGPWPIRPVPLVIFLSVFLIGFSSGVQFGVAQSRGPATAGPFSLQVLVMALASVGVAVIVTATAFALGRFLLAAGTSLGRYLLVVLASASVGGVLRVTLGQLPREPFPSTAAALLFSIARLALLELVILAITGAVASRQQQQTEIAQAALARSREHQRRLLEADEQARAQVSALLHDRVQAPLIAASLELREAALGQQESLAPIMVDVADRLERLRSLDVRGAARALSPDLANVGLRTALEDVCLQYEPMMRGTVHIDVQAQATVDDEPSLALGAYRVVEQAVMNAAAHGRARTCDVRVEAGSADGSIRVLIRDDGIGSRSSVTGFGSVVTEAWVTATGGQWSREGSETGTVVTATMGPIAHPEAGLPRGRS